MVYVLNKYGQPLMPTTRYGRVRRLLRKGLAVVVDYRPFTLWGKQHSARSLMMDEFLCCIHAYDYYIWKICLCRCVCGWI